MNPDPFYHPVLSCSESQAWEEQLLDSEESVWAAMSEVGTRLGQEIQASFAITRFPQSGLSLLGLIGKGHNGGDALLAIEELARIEGYLRAVTLVFPSELSELRPHTKRALQKLKITTTLEMRICPDEAALAEILSGSYDICLDGLLGMQFRPPLRGGVKDLITAVNETQSIRLRTAVDLPSGTGDKSDAAPFQADFTLATGILKRPLLTSEAAGTIRYLDIGFFKEDVASETRVITDRILAPLRCIRPARSEKRQHGHLAIVAGSRGMPGALSMSVQSALQSGVGLVTVFAPESVVSQLACQLPEAMWRTWPETPEGGLALEGLWQIKSFIDKATCLLLGPGMGSEAETQVLLKEIGLIWNKPALLDADALRPAAVESFAKSGNDSLALTPHDGEFKRLTGGDDCSDTAVLAYAKSNCLSLVKKGSSSRISDGEHLCINPTGNAVLSRGGSGDLLAGLIAGLMARGDCPVLESLCRGVYWHGKAADLLAVERGQVAVRSTDLLNFLEPALRM